MSDAPWCCGTAMILNPHSKAPAGAFYICLKCERKEPAS